MAAATPALRQEALDVACDLIRCPSVTGPGAERDVLRVLDAILAREPRVERRVAAARDDRPNLIATLRSPNPGPSLLLTGHLDVVPADAARWTHPPFEPVVVDGELWGRGAADMKGGLAALVVAFLHTARSGGPPCGELVLAATADEEDEGRWGLPWLLDAGVLEPDAAIVAEPAGVADDFDRIPVATRGSAFAVITVRTAGGHAAFGRDLGEHAVSVACRLQQELQARFRPSPAQHWAFPGGPTVIAGERFRGGERPGELPRHADLTISARLLPGARREAFLPELRALIEPLVPDTCELEIAFNDELVSWAGGMSLEPEHPFARLAVEAIRRAGYPDARPGGFPAFSEGAFLAAHGAVTLPALGPGFLGRAHLPDERVAVRALEASLAAYLELVEAVLRPDAGILDPTPT